MRRRLKRAALLLLSVVVGYGLLAYICAAGFWTHYEHQKGLADLPMVTRTGQGIPGDPMNVGLVGDTKRRASARCMPPAGIRPIRSR